jgi:hypothetical protein
MKCRLFEDKADASHPIYMGIRVEVMTKNRDECIKYLRSYIDKFESETDAVGASFGELIIHPFSWDKSSFRVQIAFSSIKSLEKFQDGILGKFLNCCFFDDIKRGIQHPYTEDNKEFWDLYPVTQGAYMMKSFGVMGKEDRDYPLFILRNY